MGKIWVNLNHPCYEIDMVDILKEIRPEYERAIRRQGYRPLSELRDMEEKIKMLENMLSIMEGAGVASSAPEVGALLGYACVLESMLRRRGVKLPPRPSLMCAFSTRVENGANDESDSRARILDWIGRKAIEQEAAKAEREQGGR